MLTLTDSASTVVKSLTDRPGTEDAGLRISASEEVDTGYALAVATQPDPQDAVVDQDGARVFLDPTATVALNDLTLDASVDDKNAVRFALVPQA